MKQIKLMDLIKEIVLNFFSTKDFEASFLRCTERMDKDESDWVKMATCEYFKGFSIYHGINFREIN